SAKPTDPSSSQATTLPAALAAKPPAGKFAIGNDGLVGTSLDVYSFVRSTTSLLGDATETKLGTFNVSKLNATQYSVSFSTPVTEVITPSVPEPTSMALALVGLAAFGVVAARRSAK
ncbi:MAG: PEP-CTERM sorting domain-containing protein, partial [Pseudomonadota bacterium]